MNLSALKAVSKKRKKEILLKTVTEEGREAGKDGKR